MTGPNSSLVDEAQIGLQKGAGVSKKITSDTMMTARLSVLPLACVAGMTRPSAEYAVSLKR